jgi:outer membrane murein-binding lipoprotein Lpp
MRRRTLVLPLAAVALTATVVAGCGSGSKTSTSTSAPGTAAASTSSGSSGSSGSASTPSPAATESNPSGDIPDNQAYVVHSGTAQGQKFSVKVPEGWSRTATGATVTFTDKLNRIDVTTAAATAAPTTQSVTGQVVPTLQKQVPAFAQPKVSTVSRTAGQAVLLTYLGDTAPDPVTGKIVHDKFERYAFFHNGHEVDLTLSGPTGADNVDPWKIVTDSFGWQ